jgi:hypothetical protein
MFYQVPTIASNQEVGIPLVGTLQGLTADEQPESFSVPDGRVDLGKPSAHRVAVSAGYLIGSIDDPRRPRFKLQAAIIGACDEVCRVAVSPIDP